MNLNNYYNNQHEHELTNRNQFSDYDFRKKSGGDITCDDDTGDNAQNTVLENQPDEKKMSCMFPKICV